MYLDFLSAIVSQIRLNPIMQRAKNDRSVLRALPVYDNASVLPLQEMSIENALSKIKRYQYCITNNFLV